MNGEIRVAAALNGRHTDVSTHTRERATHVHLEVEVEEREAEFME